MPETIRKELKKAQGALQGAVRSADVRWTPAEQFHLTLRFLGDVDRDRIESLIETLQNACTGFRPLRLQAEGLGFFPSAQRPRVVWAGIQDGTGQLGLLQQGIRAATSTFTLEPPETDFSAHVTLGRIKRLAPIEAGALASIATERSLRDFGGWAALEIDLMESRLASNGAVHSSLATVPLAS